MAQGGGAAWLASASECMGSSQPEAGFQQLQRPDQSLGMINAWYHRILVQQTTCCICARERERLLMLYSVRVQPPNDLPYMEDRALCMSQMCQCSRMCCFHGLFARCWAFSFSGCLLLICLGRICSGYVVHNFGSMCYKVVKCL